jgi:hypothetical protein
LGRKLIVAVVVTQLTQGKTGPQGDDQGPSCREERKVMKYKTLIALLSGSAAASSFILLLNVRSLMVSIVASILISPGAVLVAFIHSSDQTDSPLAVLTANALVYSVIALIVVIVFCRKVTTATLRLVVIRLVIPALLLVALACVPAFNRLWPRGMAELTTQEKELREAFPVGMEVERARATMRAKGIDFYERTETSETVLLERGDTRVTAQPGDRVMSARLETGATQFPCGYDIEVLLLFGSDERMRRQYVHRQPLCP